MKRKKTFIFILASFVFFIILGSTTIDLYTDWLFFKEINYGGVFTEVLSTRVILGLACGFLSLTFIKPAMTFYKDFYSQKALQMNILPYSLISLSSLRTPQSLFAPSIRILSIAEALKRTVATPSNSPVSVSSYIIISPITFLLFHF